MAKNEIFFIAVGLLLVLAAVLKLVGKMAVGIQGTELSFLCSAILLLTELGLGLWLIFKRFSERSNRLIVFFAFFSFGIYQSCLVVLGQGDCGCFGLFKLSPLAVAIFDFLIASISWILVPTALARRFGDDGSSKVEQNSNLSFSVSFICLSGFLWLTLSMMSIPLTFDSLESIKKVDFPFLKPMLRIDERIKGKAFDINSMAQSKAEINSKARVFFLQNGCAACDEIKSKLSKIGTTVQHDWKWVVVFVNGAIPLERDVNSNVQYLVARADYSWVVATPFCFELENGVVTNILDCKNCFLENTK